MSPIFFCLVSLILQQYACAEPVLNNRPIIGVLAQELIFDIKELPGPISYIAASYVKFVEGAGARAVPVKINKTKDYYEDIVNNVNGILLPGGGVHFYASGGYAEAGEMLYQLAVEKNEAGDSFPIFGICLGFELLAYLAAGNVEHRARCNSYNELLPLELKPSTFTSRMFGKAPYDIIGILAKENVTANFHHFCETEKNATELNLDSDWNFMTVNDDSHGLKYISTMEHRHFPFYGVQFHPEKNIYEWKLGKNHAHSAEGVRVAQYFANFFVNEARRSNHKFPDEVEKRTNLIYNYDVTYTGNISVFEQAYIFRENE